MDSKTKGLLGVSADSTFVTYDYLTTAGVNQFCKTVLSTRNNTCWTTTVYDEVGYNIFDQTQYMVFYAIIYNEKGVIVKIDIDTGVMQWTSSYT